MRGYVNGVFIFKHVCLMLSGLILVSCSHVGPIEIKSDRLDYNATLQHSDMQQQLLNIVRLRYSDPPYFLSVNSIVAQFNYTQKGQLSVNNDPIISPVRAAVKGMTEASFMDMPTVTYTPLQGTEFVTKLMTPVDLKVVYMLLRAGWGFNHITRPLVQRFGPIDNAVVASRVTSSRLPEYQEFMRLGHAFLILQRRQDIQFGSELSEDRFSIHIKMKNLAKLSRKDRQALQQIGVTPDTPDFWMVDRPSDLPRHIDIDTRTILAMLNYFSKGVDVSLADIKNKRVPMSYEKNGETFDWRQVTQGLFEVKVSNKKPADSFVNVQYRKQWFYIDDSDFESKETFNLIMIIMGIYQGKIEGFLPVFTVS